jgi:hypothetical protein
MRNRKPQWIEARAPGARSAAEQRIMHRHESPMTFRLAAVLIPLLVGCGSEDQSRGLRGSGDQLVRVNEIQSANNFTLVDPAGESATNVQEYDEWVELYNAGEHDAHLEGYFITDDPGQLCKQVLPPEAVVPAKGFLLLWTDNQPAQGPLHLSFGLAVGGESIYLADPSCNKLDGGTDFGSTVGFPCGDPSRQCDYSYARFPDGSGAFAWCGSPTPGASNGSACPVSE